MSKSSTWSTRAAACAGAFVLVVGAGVGTAFAADYQGGSSAQGPKGAALSALVTAGTITAAQKEEFQYEMRGAKEAAKASGARVDCAVIEAGVLSALVGEGTLTGAQADAIKAARPARPAGATGAARGAGAAGSARAAGGPLAALVADGTITLAQADAIRAAHSERTGTANRGGTATPAPVTAG